MEILNPPTLILYDKLINKAINFEEPSMVPIACEKIYILYISFHSQRPATDIAVHGSSMAVV